MNEQLNYYLYRLQTLPFGTKILLVLILNAAIVYYFYDTSIKKADREYKNLQNLKNSKEVELNELIQLKAKFPVLQKEIDNLTADLQQKLRKLPNDSEIPALLKTVSKEAIKSGLKILEFVPQAEKPEGYFVMIPVKMRAEGSYHQMSLFCDKVSKLPRIVNVVNTSLKLQRVEVGRSILSISFELQAFRFKDRINFANNSDKGV